MSLSWMPLYIGDYLRDTVHLSAAESGAYLHLLMNLWLLGSLPKNDRQLARIAKMTDREWKRSKDTIGAFFDEGWSHGRLEEERLVAEEKYSKKVAAGAAGGKAKARNAAARAQSDGYQTASTASSAAAGETPSSATANANSKGSSKPVAEVYQHSTQPQRLLRNLPSREGVGPSRGDGGVEPGEVGTHGRASRRAAANGRAPHGGGSR